MFKHVIRCWFITDLLLMCRFIWAIFLYICSMCIHEDFLPPWNILQVLAFARQLINCACVNYLDLAVRPKNEGQNFLQWIWCITQQTVRIRPLEKENCLVAQNSYYELQSVCWWGKGVWLFDHKLFLDSLCINFGDIGSTVVQSTD